MCVVVLIYKCFKYIPLLVMHGRDEDLQRPTGGAGLVEGHLFVSGLDGLRGGTWAGLNVKTGVCVVLTNVRTEDVAGRLKSRGQLVLDLLAGAAVPPSGPGRDQYAPFNVLRCDMDKLSASYHCYADEGIADPDRYVDEDVLQPGVYALSNSFLNDASWPKVDFLRRSTKDLVDKLGYDYQPENESLEQCSLVMQLSHLFERERVLSDEEHQNDDTDARSAVLKRKVFLRGWRDYGTTAHTLILRYNDEIHYMVRNVQEGDLLEWQHWTFGVGE